MLTVIPAVGVVVASFFNWRITGDITSAGLYNFYRLVQDPYFANSARVTLKIALFATAFEVVLGLAVAGSLEYWPKVRNSFRLILMLPMVISPMLAGLIWRLALDEQVGMLSRLWGSLLPGEFYPLSSANGAVTAVILVDVWQWTPFIAILISVAWEQASVRLLDQVEVDGLSGLAAFRFIWGPVLLPVIGVAMLFRLIDCLRIFDVVQVLTAGGPGNATETLSVFIYKRVIKFGDFGYAASAAVALLVLASIVWVVGERMFSLNYRGR
jgi:multiple sugar transport system permease protein